MRTKTSMSLLLAGLLGVTTAWAETSQNATSDVSVGGQASTMTQGRPNMATTNNPAVENPSAVGTMGARSPMASDASSTGAMGAAPAPVSDGSSYGTSNASVVENPSATGSDATAAPTYDAATVTAPTYSASSTSAMGAAAAPVPQDHMRRSWFNSDPRLGTGEESTVVNGQPNANPDDPLLAKTREERRAEREFKHADARTRREQAVMGSRSAPETWQQPGGTPE